MLHLKFPPPIQCSTMLVHTNSPRLTSIRCQKQEHAWPCRGPGLVCLNSLQSCNSEWSSNLGHAGGGAQEGTGSRALAGAEAAAEDMGMVACAPRGGDRRQGAAATQAAAEPESPKLPHSIKVAQRLFTGEATLATEEPV